MRKAWLWVLMIGLCLWSPVFGQEPPGQQADPAESADSETATGAEEPAAAVDPALSAEGDPLAGLPQLTILPRPVETEVLDIANDNGTGLGALWRWDGEATDDTGVGIEAEIDASLLKQFELTPEEMQTVVDARAKLAEDVAPLVGPRDKAAAELAVTEADLTLAQNNREARALDLLREKWRLQNERDELDQQINDARDRYMSIVGKLDEKEITFRYLQATLARSPWLLTNTEPAANADIQTKADYPNRFGHEPDEGDKKYLEVNQVVAFHPDVLAGTYVDGQRDIYDQVPPKSIQIPLPKNEQRNLRMLVSIGEAAETTDLGGAASRVNYFNTSLVNNLIFAVLFAAIILAAIVIARRNPNLFIRRINGLEAVDEAIGRATEMGKPVLYLTGLDALGSLSTLAAVNILGRVARRIADFDSDLIVPNRDPVTLTVAQEVVREAYTDQGRPDAYKQDNIFFVTDDQFAFTAAVCAIMIREKPAANFFMGYYYAESLLLAETGASTGAIQIAGTDSTSQLPFFIVTCDYTLIGEELYAASAYLSREPMLLGSLKGQDVGKAVMMILIVLQTALFLIRPEWDFLKILVEAL